MRKVYDDFEEFELDDNEIVRRIMREQAREEMRMASRRRKGPASRYPSNGYDYDDESDLDDDYDDFAEYEDYDEDEFDSYAGASDWR